MNYTEKYHLPQWEETDRIMRTDFNQMCADMEAGLKQNAQAAAGALAAANSKPTSAAVSQAQSTANQALSAANAAQTTANAAYSPSYKPYVVGSYAGTGTTDIPVNLGFRPKFLVISAQTLNQNNAVTDCIFLIDGFTSDAVAFTSTGFTVLQPPYGGQYVTYYPRLFQSGKTYYYIAFR